MTRVVGYTRVSTTGQVEEGFSLAAQERAIRKWCAEQDYPEPTMRVDAGVSAFSDTLARRPVLAATLEDIKAGRFDTLVVAKLDRLARYNLVAVQILETLYRCGCRLVSLADGYDFSTANGRFMYQIRASVAELESGMISDRTKAGIAEKRLQGGYHGQIPFGAMYGEGGRLVINPAQEEALALILTLCAFRGAASVAALMTEAGVLTQRGNEAWRPSSIRSVIESGAWLLDQPEPWPARYREARDRPPLPKIGKPGAVNLLSGLLRCACGGVLVYSTTKRSTGARYLECRRYGKDRPSGVGCPFIKTSVDHYEAVVTDVFLSLPPLHELPEDAGVAEARVRIAERRRVAEELYYENLDRASYQARKAALDAEEATLPLPLPLGRALVEEIARGQALWPLATVRERNAILRSLFQRVIVTGRAVEIVPIAPLAHLLAGNGAAGLLRVG